MTLARGLSLCIAWGAIAVGPAAAQSSTSAQARDRSAYRQFHLGMTLAAVASEVGPSHLLSVLHRRPVLIQEVVWYPARAPSARPDDETVREMQFTFYDGALYRMVIEYDRKRTEGLTADDMVDALAVQYGPASRPRVPIMASLSTRADANDEVLASWDDPRVALTLFRPSYLAEFGLVVCDRAVDRLARQASDAATRLDAQEAPERDRELRLAQSEEKRLNQAKARQTNKETFRP